MGITNADKMAAASGCRFSGETEVPCSVAATSYSTEYFRGKGPEVHRVSPVRLLAQREREKTCRTHLGNSR